MSTPDDVEKAKAASKRLMPGTARRLGHDNTAWVIELAASLDEIRGQVGLREILGPRAGIVVAAVLLLPLLLGWLAGFEGFVAGLMLSVAVPFLWRAFRSTHTNKAIHPGGAGGYDDAQRLLDRHRNCGTEQHRIARMYSTYAIGRFVYTGSVPSRFSWRAFALVVLVLIALWRFPLIGVAIVTLLLSIVWYAFSASRMPIALYLGPSTIDALLLFWRIRYGTGIAWASLLKDPLGMPPEADGSIEQQLDGLTNAVYSNPWSLRFDANEDWLAIVRDFIAASAVIVVKAADVPAVLRELDLLRFSRPLERIVVVADEAFPLSLLPTELRPAVMTEADAMALLALIASQPRAFRRRMSERAGLFSMPAAG